MRLTDKQYKEFVEHIRGYSKKLGLGDWEIQVKKENIGDEVSATVSRNADNRIAVVRLNTEHNKEDLKDRVYFRRIAFEEVVHILLGDLSEQALRVYKTPNELEKAEHYVVRNLWKALGGDNVVDMEEPTGAEKVSG